MLAMTSTWTAATRRVYILIALVGAALAVVSAQPFAGSWNDGSRLAAVESLADRHTFAIDDSLFTRPSLSSATSDHPPYPPERSDLLTNGTSDKLFIGGHFYSDKPAVITVLMAGIYQGAKLMGLPAAADRPDLFCRFLTIATSGAAYVVALLGLFWMTQQLRLPLGTALLLVASLALGTIAFTYTRYVNNHILLLGVVAGIICLMEQLARVRETGGPWLGRMIALGTLAGVGFNLDLGAGPLLCVFLFGLVAFRWRRLNPVIVFVLAAAPWVVASLAINHAIGGVWKPINMVPEYSLWPGCPFTEENLTGFLRHSPGKFVVYSLALLFGKHGFISHNIPLMLALPAAWIVLRQRSKHRPELLCLTLWCAATWLNYAVFSNNYGGACCSVRWFVPFLAPGYYLLAIYLRDNPDRRRTLLVLSVWGTVLGAIMWHQGPWTGRMIVALWPIVGAALLTWGTLEVRRKRAAQADRNRNGTASSSARGVKFVRPAEERLP